MLWHSWQFLMSCASEAFPGTVWLVFEIIGGCECRQDDTQCLVHLHGRCWLCFLAQWCCFVSAEKHQWEKEAFPKFLHICSMFLASSDLQAGGLHTVGWHWLEHSRHQAEKVRVCQWARVEGEPPRVHTAITDCLRYILRNHFCLYFCLAGPGKSSKPSPKNFLQRLTIPTSPKQALCGDWAWELSRGTDKLGSTNWTHSGPLLS